MMKCTLRLTQTQHESLRRHLLPGDGLEAVVVGVCGRRKHKGYHALTLKTIVPIPYNECKERTPDRVTWSTEKLVPLLHEAEKHDLAVIKIHSHPGGYSQFSDVDDYSDGDLFNSVFGWTDSQLPQCSAVMLPTGEMFGRVIKRDGKFQRLDSILVAGDDIRVWTPRAEQKMTEALQRHGQLFGSGTMKALRELSIAVVGCSGTGSPLVEQLARLGVGRIILVDPDRVEIKNLNRILNSTYEDAVFKRPKVEVLGRAIARMGLGTEVEMICDNLITPVAIQAVASCDIIFGCVDSVEGRHVLNRLAAYYLLPYFDVGVRLEADGKGGIQEACGAVHYVRPDGSTLLDRKVYTMAQVKAEGLRRTDPKAYQDQLRAGYIHGVQEDRPAVISINMQMASSAVNEFLARLHPYRLDSNAGSSAVRNSFIQSFEYREAESDASGMFSKIIGRGDVEPLLGMPELSASENRP